jgi:hypothetical protein
LGPGVAGPAAVRALSLGLTPLGMRALHGWDHPPRASHAVNALKDQTVGGVPPLTPWIITIPGRRPVPSRPRGFREPPACGCSPAMQSGRRPPQTTGGNREPEVASTSGGCNRPPPWNSGHAAAHMAVQPRHRAHARWETRGGCVPARFGSAPGPKV